MSRKADSLLHATIERVAQVKATLPSAKQIAAERGVTPSYVERLLREATRRARKFVLSDLKDSQSS